MRLAFGGLWLDQSVGAAIELVADGDRAAWEVDVAPAEAEQLAAAHTGEDRGGKCNPVARR